MFNLYRSFIFQILSLFVLLSLQYSWADPAVIYHAPNYPDLVNEANSLQSSAVLDNETLQQYGTLPGFAADDDLDGVVNLDDNCPNSPKEVEVDGCGCKIELDNLVLPAADVANYRAQLLTEDTVNFELNRSRLTLNALSILEDYLLRVDGDKESVNLVGHCDSTGSDSYNQRLSERRASSVQTFLEQNGVQSQVIVAKGAGEKQPKFSNDARSDRKRNRRVEMLIQHVAEYQGSAAVLKSYADAEKNLSTVYFLEKNDYLMPNGERILNKLAQYLLDEQEKIITIVGHAGGSDIHATDLWRLGYQRAYRVTRYLWSLGIPKTRIKLLSVGHTQPQNIERNSESSAAERRVKIYFADYKKLLANPWVANVQQQTSRVAINQVSDKSSAAAPAAAAMNDVKATQIVPTAENKAFNMVFASDSAGLTEQQKSILRGLASVLKQDPSIRVLLTGYPDLATTTNRARAFAYLRAYTVKQYLLQQGVAWRRFKVWAESTVGDVAGVKMEYLATAQ